MIELRPLTIDDASTMLDILTDCHIKQSYMLPDFAQKQDASPLFYRLMELSLDDAHYVRAICLNNMVIGFLNDVETESKSIELGYVIHPVYQRRGYMTQALGIAIRELFAQGYQQILTGAFEENHASIRVMEKCGMQRLKKTDTIEYRDKTHLCVYYSIRKQE